MKYYTRNSDNIINEIINKTVSSVFARCNSIAQSTFANCFLLTDINFPFCKEVGERAFESCYALQNVSIPTCKALNTGAFGYCSSLTSISLPFCSNIELECFTMCISLESVYMLSNSVAALGSFAFSNTPIEDSSILGYYGSIYVPENLVEDYKVAENWSQYSDRITAYSF